jgi:hypothetical protein
MADLPSGRYLGRNGVISEQTSANGKSGRSGQKLAARQTGHILAHLFSLRRQHSTLSQMAGYVVLGFCLLSEAHRLVFSGNARF